MEMSGDSIQFTGTDLDIEIRDTCVASVAASGATTVPSHMLHDIVRKMPDGAQIVLDQADEGVVVVKAGRSRFKVNCLPVSDFPDLAMEGTNHTFMLAPATLKNMFEKVSFAISTEETRYYLNGVYFHVHGDSTLRAVATDGHRLSTQDIELPDGVEDAFGVIVPRRTVAEVQRLAAEAQEDIRVSLSAGKIRFEFADVVLTSKLIDGTFPDYGRVIPQNNNRIAKVERSDLQAALERVATISGERGKAVKFAFSSGKLLLSVTDPDSGSAEEELATEYDGGAFEIGFNSGYANDILRTLDGEAVTLRMADPGSPTLLIGGDEAHTCVLMPMRV